MKASALSRDGTTTTPTSARAFSIITRRRAEMRGNPKAADNFATSMSCAPPASRT